MDSEAKWAEAMVHFGAVIDTFERNPYSDLVRTDCHPPLLAWLIIGFLSANFKCRLVGAGAGAAAARGGQSELRGAGVSTLP